MALTSSPAPVAFLGPAGTYTELAALLACPEQPHLHSQGSHPLVPYPTIIACLEAVATGQQEWAVVPVENSVEGGVSMTLDALWQLEGLQIYQALILPIRHALMGRAKALEQIEQVYSHPQALAQCQVWLGSHLPQATLIPTRSTTEELDRVQTQPMAAVIASERAAALYKLPILACPINDHPDNCTRFWVIGRSQPKADLASPGGSHTSLAFSLPENVPGALLKPLQVFAEQGLNMSRIESRPTKKSAGTYVFFVDLENAPDQPYLSPKVIAALEQIAETLKLLGSYPVHDLSKQGGIAFPN
ncbi:prephenate dehydratase [Thermostichus vulcanus]|uniref:Prephenate dehydratase n=1 Tax=Thermostichus vulcanus str. 'Rupite' TaxID=2813851 RepID=A0ABT0CFE4_THEVL|nr:prephenate dehydratase [Thermostichus vulcanus]MCJ2544486.1 prephenate dehydratase [Thermostichus vulcanus str. 'Rupite']